MDESGFSYGNLSDTGKVREKNEDYFGTTSTPHGILFLVCDGMGGHKGGQRASRLAVEVIQNSVIDSNSNDPVALLDTAQKTANEKIIEEAAADPGLTGMGTTSVALLLQPGNKPKAWISHVGDSRIYRIRQGRIEAITIDHSVVMEMVKHGIITAEQARTHPKSNVITQALGSKETIKPDTIEIEVCKNDRYILCSDGLTDLVEDEEILKLSKGNSHQELAEKLVHLANEYGGIDNSTVQVIDIEKGPKSARLKPKDATGSKQTPGKVPLIRKLNRHKIPYIASIAVVLVLLFLVLFTDRDIEASVTYTESKNEHDQPVYEITVATDSANTVEFDNPFVEKISDFTFGVLADAICSRDLDLIPDSVYSDSVYLSYMVVCKSDSLLDSLMIVNKYRPIAIPEIEIIESGVAVRMSVDSGTVLTVMNSPDSIPILSSGSYEWQYPNPDSLVGVIKQNADSTIRWTFSYTVFNGTGNTYADSRLVQYTPSRIDEPVLTSLLDSHLPGVIIIRGEVQEPNVPIHLTYDIEGRDSTISNDTGKFVFEVHLSSGEHNITLIANPTNMLANETHEILTVLERPRLNNMDVLVQDDGSEWRYISITDAIMSFDDATGRVQNLESDGTAWRLPTTDELADLTIEFRLDQFGFNSVFQIPDNVRYLFTANPPQRFLISSCRSRRIDESILLEKTALLVIRN